MTLLSTHCFWELSRYFGLYFTARTLGCFPGNKPGDLLHLETNKTQGIYTDLEMIIPWALAICTNVLIAT
jgi:hypothetical protein